jgi:aspartate 1-decarboxylase
MLKSKIHRATVTDANLHYEGSITIDAALMKKADILEYEKVEVLNLHNGHRLGTYAIAGKPGSGVICLNGPAARAACAGDKVIVLSYLACPQAAARKIKPKVVRVDERNRIKN